MPRIKVSTPDNPRFRMERKVGISDLNYAKHLDSTAMVAILHEARLQMLGDLGFTERLAATLLLGASMTIGFVPSLVTQCTNADARGIAEAVKRSANPKTPAVPVIPPAAPKATTPAPSAR